MRQGLRRGFTLIELLVVVGIIVLLATFLLPMVQRAQTQARRTSMAADLLVISQALEAYKGDFGDYPRLDHTANVVTGALVEQGATILCWALVAPGPAVSSDPLNNPGDGADGPGFRLRGTVGPIKGPYLPPDRFLIGPVDGVGVVHAPGALVVGATASFNNNQDVLADRSLSPILYYPATRGANPSEPPNGFVKPMFFPLHPLNAKTATPALVHLAVFNFDDNHVYLDDSHTSISPSGSTVSVLGVGNPANLTRGANLVGWRVMSYRLGDSDYDGTVDNNEVPVTTGPYLLWSAGPDQIFGNDDDVMCDGTQLQQVTGLLPFPIMPK
jgi:prepilin-type N-terminal cleavage/methylation domain-containing protein